jgi:DNA-binding response OmpR family regulator
MSHILVVEDETNVRKLVTVNLTNRGHLVSEAGDAQQALIHLRSQSFDLIVLDIKLPDITGWNILAQVAADTTLQFNSPVLVMTASIADARIDLEQYPMVVEVLVKPFSAAKLMAAIERGLRTALPHRT